MKAPGARKDAAEVSRPVYLMEWRYQAATNGQEFVFEQALDREGRIVQEVAFCGSWVFVGTAEEAECSHTARVLFFAAGHSGGAGAAPLWGRGERLVEGRLARVLPVFEDEPRAFGFDVASLSRDGARCWEIYGRETPAHFRGLFFNVVAGPFVVCEHLALPVEFVAVARVADLFHPEDHVGLIRYVLVDASEGSGGDSRPNEADLGAPAARTFVPWTPGPFPRGSDDPFPFALAEAIAAAEELHEGLRAFTAAAPYATATFRYQVSGSQGTIFGINRTDHVAVFELVRPDGGYSVRVMKTVESNPLGVPQVSYTIQHASAVAAEPWMQAFQPAPMQLSVRASFETGAALMGTSYAGEPSTVRALAFSHSWIAASDVFRTTGYEIGMRYTDPKPRGMHHIPPQAVFDGATGLLLSLDLDREERLPF